MPDLVTTLFFALFGMGYIGSTYHYLQAFKSRYHPSTWFGHVSGAIFALCWPIPFLLGLHIAFLGGTPRGLLGSPFAHNVEVWDAKQRRWVPMKRRTARALQVAARQRDRALAQSDRLIAARAREEADRETEEARLQAVFDEWQSRAGFWLQKLGEAERMLEDDLRREAAMHLAQENLDFLEQTKPVNPFIEHARKAVQLDESSAAASVGSANSVSSPSYGEYLKRLEKRASLLLDDLDASSNQRSLTLGGAVGPCATCGTNRFLIDNLCPGCTQNLRKIQERAAHAKIVPFDDDDLLES